MPLFSRQPKKPPSSGEHHARERDSSSSSSSSSDSDGEHYGPSTLQRNQRARSQVRDSRFGTADSPRAKGETARDTGAALPRLPNDPRLRRSRRAEADPRGVEDLESTKSGNAPFRPPSAPHSQASRVSRGAEYAAHISGSADGQESGRANQRRSCSDIPPHTQPRTSILRSGSIAANQTEMGADSPSKISRPPFRSPHVGPLLQALSRLLREQGECLGDYFEMEDFIGDKKKDAAARKAAKAKVEARQNGKDAMKRANFQVVGASLIETVTYAPSSVVIGNHRHDIPSIVHVCLDELSRTGIYQQGLFRALPNRPRLSTLVDSFNGAAAKTPGLSSMTPTLGGEPMPTVCALMSTFLDGLPEPLLNRTFQNALWAWCVKPSLVQEDKRRAAELDENELDEMHLRQRQRSRAQSDPAVAVPHASQTRRSSIKKGAQTDEPQIAIARLVLLLLPQENFSLLVYLLNFFIQVPLCPDNGIVFEDMARMFAGSVIGGPSKNGARVSMLWLLNRWPRIAEGLLGDEEDIASRGPVGKGHVEKVVEAGKRARSASSPYCFSSGDLRNPRDEQEREIANFERAVHSQIQDRLGLPSRRKFSSFSSDGSNSTFASSAGSDAHGHSLPRPRPTGTMIDESTSSTARPRVIEGLPSPAYGGINDFIDYYRDNGELKSQPVSEGAGISVSPHHVVSGQSSEDSSSTYSTDDWVSVRPSSDASSRSPRSRQGSLQRERAGMPQADVELETARKRIAELERELRIVRTKSSDVQRGESRPRDRARSPSRGPRDRRQRDAPQMDVRKQLAEALGEGSDARQLMLGFKEIIDDVLEKAS